MRDFVDFEVALISDPKVWPFFPAFSPKVFSNFFLLPPLLRQSALAFISAHLLYFSVFFSLFQRLLSVRIFFFFFFFPLPFTRVCCCPLCGDFSASRLSPDPNWARGRANHTNLPLSSSPLVRTLHAREPSPKFEILVFPPPVVALRL